MFNQKRMMDDIIKLAGEEFEVLRDDNVRTIKGARNTQKSTNRKYVQFYPGTDIKVGDLLIRKLTGDKWAVIEVDPRIVHGQVFSVNVFYQTEVEREKQRPQAASYTFNNSSNIIAGSQASATMNVNIGEIESEIQERGGPDKEELLEMVSEIKQAFEKKDTLSKGSLVRFSETLEKHSWITSSLIQLLGSAAIQFFIR